MFKQDALFHFRLDNPKILTQERWIRHDYVSMRYLIYKLSLSFYFIAGYIVSIYYNTLNGSYAYDWLKLTYYTCALTIISFIYNTILVVIRYVQENKQQYEMSEYFFEKNHISIMISWVLSSASNSLSLCVAVVYWTALYSNSGLGCHAMKIFINVDLHVIHAMISIIDVIVSSRPWRFSHLYISLMFGLFYLGYHLIYILRIGGENEKGQAFIYPILNWKVSPGKATGWVFAMLLASLLAHGFFCVLSFARNKVWKKWSSRVHNATITGHMENNETECTIDIDNEFKPKSPSEFQNALNNEIQNTGNNNENEDGTNKMSERNLMRIYRGSPIFPRN